MNERHHLFAELIFSIAVNIQALEALTDQSLPRYMLRPQTDGSSWQNHPEQCVSRLLPRILDLWLEQKHALKHQAAVVKQKTLFLQETRLPWSQLCASPQARKLTNFGNDRPHSESLSVAATGSSGCSEASGGPRPCWGRHPHMVGLGWH